MIFVLALNFFLVLLQYQDSFENYEQPVPGIEEPIIMVPIQGGTYMMGSDNPDFPNQGPPHQVTVHDFWMGAYEISWTQFEAFSNIRTDFVINDSLQVLGIDGLSGATAPYDDMSYGMGKDGFPAVNITQYAAQMYCKWLTAQTGIFYRLPTEAEWEYACRAGAVSDSFLEAGADIQEYAFFKKNAGVEYMEIGKLKPNPFGLYDILGNVSEWTLDQYSEDFYGASDSTVNPWLVPTVLYPRTVRGGSWKDKEERCSCTFRMKSKPNWKRQDPQFPKSRWWHTNASYVGFRIVRPGETPPTDEIRKFWLEPMDDFN